MKAAELKRGNVYSKNGYTIYFSAGMYVYSCYDMTNKYYTLKELKADVLKQLKIRL